MKLVILVAPIGYRDTIEACLDAHQLSNIWWEPDTDHNDMCSVRLLTGNDNEQSLLDDLEKIISGSDEASIYTVKVDSSFPRRLPFSKLPALTRDELQTFAEQGARSDALYLLLITLSTIVATIGLLQDNIAVVIGAMVIAPLLGPNLASALGIALGQFALARRAAATLSIGIVCAFALSFITGLVWPTKMAGAELLSRTIVGIDSPVLALASGAAGVLSLTSGVPGVLVGVMVAVALLPPLAASGILLAWGDTQLSANALLLFVINVAAINLSAHVTLYFSAVKPRTPAISMLAQRNSLYSSIVWFAIIVGLTWVSVNFIN
jgi:uncharacterized hydrophobic protein (TIGR00341 family)